MYEHDQLFTPEYHPASTLVGADNVNFLKLDVAFSNFDCEVVISEQLSGSHRW